MVWTSVVVRSVADMGTSLGPDEPPPVDADPADALDQYRTIPDDDDNWPIEPTP